MSKDSGHLGGITPKAQRWVAKIMKAYCAQFAPMLNTSGNGLWLPGSQDSLTFSEEKPVTSEQLDHNPAVAVSSPETEPRFHLDSNPTLRSLWAERERRRRQNLDNEKWLKEFDKKLAAAMGAAEELFLDGARVAVYAADGSFKKKQFLDEQPEVAETCSEYQRVLNLDLVKKKFPEIYAMYRARTMRTKDEPVTPE